jgi:hypothetical protein
MIERYPTDFESEVAGQIKRHWKLCISYKLGSTIFRRSDTNILVSDTFAQDLRFHHLRRSIKNVILVDK